MSRKSALQSTLLQVYRRVLGDPDSEIDVYLGFALFVGAAVVASFAIVALVYADGLGRQAMFLWREQAITAAMVAFPLLVLGVIVLLPVDRRGQYSGLAGALVCLYGIYRFRAVYPWQWDSGAVQHSITVIAVYSAGVAILVAAMGAALIAYQIARLRRPGPGDIEQTTEDPRDEQYSDARIEQDIEEAMADVDLTWGGVERTETTRLDLETAEHEADIDTSGLQAATKRVSTDSVDEQVAGLKALRGDQQRADRSVETVDEQSARLAELRQRRRSESTEEDSFLASLLRRLGLLD